MRDRAINCWVIGALMGIAAMWLMSLIPTDRPIENVCVEWIAVLRPTGEVPRACPGGHVEFTPSTEGPVACCRCERRP